MIAQDKEFLAGRLRESVAGIELPTSQPDLGVIRRRGAARRRRRQVVSACTFALVLAVSGSVAATVDLDGADRVSSGFAGSPSTVDEPDRGPSDPSAVQRLMDTALGQAAVAFPDLRATGDGLVELQMEPRTGKPFMWSRFWAVESADQKANVFLEVYPKRWLDESSYPCLGSSDDRRGCKDEVLDNGVRLLSGESLGGGFSSGLAGYNMWGRAALAVYPDGRQVSMMVLQPETTKTELVVEDYRGPITLDQLRQVVSNPVLAQVDVTG